MEAKLERPSHGHEDCGTHSVVVGEDEGAKQHEEKKSLLKKVKDKAKKIKDTIKKHGHGHYHHDQRNDDTRRYESSVVRETNLDKPKDDGYNDDDHHHHRVTDHGQGDDRQALAPENKNGLPITDRNNAKIESPHCPNNTPAKLGTSSGGADHQTSNKPVSESASDCAHKPYEKVAGGSSGGVKEYLSEKLKPGDEDKALSEAITDALHKGGREGPVPPPRGKVTVSKEVAERLGLDRESKREGEDAVVAGEHSSGNTVSERLQDAFTSWLSKGTGIQTAQDSIANAFVNNAGPGSGGDDGPKSDSRNEPRHR